MAASDRTPETTQAAKHMHLRAAAGRTACLLVPLPAEWRWGAAGGESAWFPGFTLYRESPATGWGGALAQLRVDLAAVRAGEARPAAAYD